MVLNFTGTNRHSGTGVLESVVVDPSAGAWAVVIQDLSGKVIFQAGGAADESFFAGPLNAEFVDLNVTTATNITNITCYIK